MQAQPPKLDITIQLGKQTTENQQMLARVAIRNHSGQAQVSQVKQNAKITQVGENLVCLLKYSVYPGRQNEALKYLEQGFELSIDKQQMSPLQFITRKYEGDDGFVENKMYTQPGFVCVYYKFKIFSEIQEEQELTHMLSQLKDFRNFQMELTLRGFVSHSLKNRTNVKVDYAKFNLSSEHIDIPIIHDLMMATQFLPSQITLNPFYATYQKAKKLHLFFRLKSFRQINKYYEEISNVLGNSYKKQEKQDFRYVVPGLFRQKVEGYLFQKQDFAVSADISHHGQQIFMRLVKVYFKAAKKAIDY